MFAYEYHYSTPVGHCQVLPKVFYVEFVTPERTTMLGRVNTNVCSLQPRPPPAGTTGAPHMARVVLGALGAELDNAENVCYTGV